MVIGDLPTGWTWTTLTETSEVILGQSPNSDTYNTAGIGLPFYQGKAEFGDLYPTTVKWCSTPGKIAEAGDILISVRAPVGPTNLCQEKSCIGRGLAAVRPKGGMPNKYLLYYLRFIEKEWDSKATGTTFKAITGDILRQQEIPLAPLSEQERIVAKIEELFTQLEAGTAALERVQAGLKRYRRSVLLSMCGGNFVEGKLGIGKAEERELPKDWQWTTIGDVIDSLDNMRIPVNKKEREKRQGKYPYYGANGQVDWIDDYIFDEPLVLLVEDETFTGREKPFSYKITGKTWVNNHAHVLRAKDGILDIDYLNYSLAYYPFTPMTTGTTGRKKLIKSVMMAAPYPLPPLEEQRQIVAEVERRLSLAAGVESALAASLARAARLRQAVLKSAFEGKL
jgi:type I restriction enzyme S subunit